MVKIRLKVAQMNDDEIQSLQAIQAIQANRLKRPRYRAGDRIQIDAAGPFQGWRGTVRSVSAIQTLTGVVSTYMYKLQMENLSYQMWPEDSLRPLAGDSELPL